MTVYDPRYSSSTLMLLLCLLGMLMSASALSYMTETESDTTECVSVNMVHYAHTRQKRFAKQLPDILHFRFKLGESTIQLNMSKSEREIDSIPIYTSDGRGTTLHESIPIEKDVAVYQDDTRGAVVIARRLGDMVYHVAGNFHHGNQQYKIWPETHDMNKRSAVNTHRLRQVKEYDLHHDTRALPAREGQGRGKRSVNTDRIVRSYDNIPLHRQRRQTKAYVIEIGVLPDYSDFSFFYNDTGGNMAQALTNIRTYYAFVEESIQLRYNTINAQDASVSVKVWIKYVNAATDPESSPWTESLKDGFQIQDDDSLNAFTDYIEDVSKAVPEADHYMSFTRLDLEDRGNTGVAGIAFLASLCTTAATSLIENTLDGFTAALAAHELGHSMDGQHDSAVGCDDADRYVMSTFLSLPSSSRPSSLWTFSPCSVATFKKFLAEPSSSCASETTISSGLSDGGVPAGQVFDADYQCARVAGEGSIFCRTSYKSDAMFEEMCQVLWCSGPDGDIDVCDAYIALEGTSCGDSKWCEKGMCVSAPSSLGNSANCPQDDDPTAPCNVTACDTYAETQLLLCCATCSLSDNTTTTTTTTTTVETTTMGTASTTEEATAMETTTDIVQELPTTDSIGPEVTSSPTDTPVSSTQGTTVSVSAPSETPTASPTASSTPQQLGPDVATPSIRNVERFIFTDCSLP